MHQQINREWKQRNSYPINDTVNSEKEGKSNPNNNDRNTHSNHTEQTQIKEKMKIEKLNRIMSEKKTRLPLLKKKNKTEK